MSLLQCRSYGLLKPFITQTQIIPLPYPIIPDKSIHIQPATLADGIPVWPTTRLLVVIPVAVCKFGRLIFFQRRNGESEDVVEGRKALGLTGGRFPCTIPFSHRPNQC